MKRVNKQFKNIVIEKYPATGNQLNVKVHGSKNGALAVVMYTFLLGKGNVIRITNVPYITDIVHTLEMFKEMGGKFRYSKNKNELTVFEGIKNCKISSRLLNKTRASVLLMSIVLVKYGSVSFPKKVGGCNLGHRPYDYHLDAFKKLGCVIDENNDNYTIKKNKIVKNVTVNFKNKTTTGTENALFLANFNSKNIIINKAHLRPEVLELIKFINALGGSIGIRKKSIFINETQGRIENKRVTFRIIDDLEEALSYIAIGFITDSTLKIQFNNSYKYKEIQTLINLSHGSLKKKGCYLIQTPYVACKHKFVKIITAAYPGFGSDAQPIMASILLKISESFKIIDTRFKNRFKYSAYFEEFGIKSKKTSKYLYVPSTQQRGRVFEQKNYHVLTAYDLRSGMNAILTASISRRKAIILNADLVFRGHDNFFEFLRKLKFKIVQV